MKQKCGGFLSLLLITSGASLFGNMEPGKRVIRAELSHPLTNFEIQKILK